MTAIGIVLLALGTLITSVNCYLSFLRYPVHLLRGGTQENYRWVSGLPVFGSLLLWISVPFLSALPGLMCFALLFSLLDTVGLHWFVVAVLMDYFCATPKQLTVDPEDSSPRPTSTVD
jgi:hypothetical protein